MRKRADIEFLRVLSTFGIVWFHSGVFGHEFAYSGLIVFLILSMYLAGGSGAADVLTLRRRLERLVVPWFFWCAVYVGLNVFRGVPAIPMDGGLVAGVLAGPSIHLWYMPFIFMCLLALDVIKSHLSQSCIAIGSGVAAFLILSTVSLWRPISMELILPLPQWAHASAAIFIGVFFLYFHQVSRFVGGALLLSILSAAVYATSVAGVGSPYLVGLMAGALIVFRLLEGFKFDFGFFSECALGVYFIHVFIIFVFFKFGGVSGWLFPFAVFFVSILVVLVVRRLFPRVARYWS